MASIKSILIAAAVIGVVALVAQAKSDDMNISLFKKIFSKFTDSRCDKCIARITDVKEKIKDPNYVESMYRQAEQVCYTLPFKEECIKQIDEQLDVILESIKTKEPIEVCKDFHLCPQ